MHVRSRWLVALLIAGTATAAAAQDDGREGERDYLQRRAGGQAPQDPRADAGAEREAQIAQFLAEADRLIRDKNYDSRQTAHYRVQTDDPRLSPGSAAQLLESFRAYFGEFWRDRAPLRDYPAPSRVLLFYSYFKYNQLLTGRPRFDEARSSGHYRPYVDVVVLHTDAAGGDGLEDTLVHEAAHQLIGQQLYGAGAEQIHWVAEGLAAYFGYTAQAADGTFQPGVIGGKATSVFRGAAVPASSAGPRRLQEFRQALRRGSAPKVTDLIAITDPAAFYGEGLQDRYTASWLLVHYLLHGEDGALEAGFLRFLQADDAGAGEAGDLYRAIGRTPEQVEEGFRTYVQQMKNRPARRAGARPPGASELQGQGLLLPAPDDLEADLLAAIR
jgi:hypothetical protein